MDAQVAQTGFSVWGVIGTIGGAVITAVIGAIYNGRVTSRNAGKTEGVIQEAMRGLGRRVTAVEDDNKQQWSKIHEHTEDIGYLRGRLNGGSTQKAHGHTS